MSTPGQPLSIAELIDYIETHKRGTIDDEVVAALKLVSLGREVVEDFMPNIGQCALQNYGNLNEFLLRTAPL